MDTSHRRNPRHYERRREFHAAVSDAWHAEQSVQKIAADLGVSRNMVKSCLADLDLPIRSGSEANQIRMDSLTDDERRALSRAANEAARNSGRQAEVRHRAALARQRNRTHVGRFEAHIAKHLTAHGIETIPQYAWGRYNVDLFVEARRIAVEVACSQLRPVFVGTAAQKTMELLSAGISVVHLWVQTTRGETVEGAMLDQLVTFVDVASPSPAGLGQYRVIRGRGDLDPVSQSYLDNFADVAVRYRSLQSGRMDER